MAVIRLILPILLLGISGALAQNANRGVVVCYFSNWAVYRPGAGSYALKDIPTSLCTHVIYSFIGLNAQTNDISILDPNVDVNKGGFENCVGLKKANPSLKTLIAIGGWNEGSQKYSQMSASKDRRDTFIRSIVAFLNKYKFDGLDIDWEYPGASDRGGAPADKVNFVKLAEELRNAFDREGKGWELSMATPAANYRLQVGYNIPALCKIMDQVSVMTYDMRGSWMGCADVHSPLFKRPFDTADYASLNVHDVMANWISLGCPPNKLVMGVPFYGKSFTLTNPSGNKELGTRIPTSLNGVAGQYTGEGGLLAYNEICDKSQGWTYKWDNVGKVPYAYKGDQWVGYEDEKSIQIKMDHVKEMGLKGGMMWAMDMDDFNGLCGTKNPLLTVMSNSMSSYKVPGLSANPVPRPTASPLPDVPQVSPTKPAPVNPVNPQQPSTNIPAPNCATSAFAPHQNCQKFYQCVYGRAVEMNCQPGLAFNSQTSTCDWPANNPRPECRG